MVAKNIVSKAGIHIVQTTMMVKGDSQDCAMASMEVFTAGLRQSDTRGDTRVIQGCRPVADLTTH